MYCDCTCRFPPPSHDARLHVYFVGIFKRDHGHSARRLAKPDFCAPCALHLRLCCWQQCYF